MIEVQLEWKVNQDTRHQVGRDETGQLWWQQWRRYEGGEDYFPCGWNAYESHHGGIEAEELLRLAEQQRAVQSEEVLALRGLSEAVCSVIDYSVRDGKVTGAAIIPRPHLMPLAEADHAARRVLAGQPEEPEVAPFGGTQADRARLGDDLCRELLPHVGVTGANEGAVDTLRRLLAELANLRSRREARGVDVEAVRITAEWLRGMARTASKTLTKSALLHQDVATRYYDRLAAALRGAGEGLDRASLAQVKDIASRLQQRVAGIRAAGGSIPVGVQLAVDEAAAAIFALRSGEQAGADTDTRLAFAIETTKRALAVQARLRRVEEVREELEEHLAHGVAAERSRRIIGCEILRDWTARLADPAPENPVAGGGLADRTDEPAATHVYDVFVDGKKVPMSVQATTAQEAASLATRCVERDAPATAARMKVLRVEIDPNAKSAPEPAATEAEDGEEGGGRSRPRRSEREALAIVIAAQLRSALPSIGPDECEYLGDLFAELQLRITAVDRAEKAGE